MKLRLLVMAWFLAFASVPTANAEPGVLATAQVQACLIAISDGGITIEGPIYDAQCSTEWNQYGRGPSQSIGGHWCTGYDSAGVCTHSKYWSKRCWPDGYCVIEFEEGPIGQTTPIRTVGDPGYTPPQPPPPISSPQPPASTSIGKVVPVMDKAIDQLSTDLSKILPPWLQ